LSFGQYMADIYYGVAGKPVSHSISPILMSIVAQHLEQQDVTGIKFNIKSLNLIEADSIQDALAWGYAKTIPEPVNWNYTNSPFGKFRNRALIQKALEITESIKEGNKNFIDRSDTINRAKFPLDKASKLPNKPFSEEIWINLTTPLKHQLTSQAVMDFNESSKIESVNVLRWDGHGWWSSNVDGCGVVRCAEYFGIDVKSGGILCLIGGGSAARSTAYAWTKSGGKLKLVNGRRELKEGPWSKSIVESDDFDLLVNFDNDEISDELLGKGVVLSPKYKSMDGDVDERCKELSTQHYDGRWMLVAQHLECWRQLWAPQNIEILPSMSLLMTKLVHAETVLASYT